MHEMTQRTLHVAHLDPSRVAMPLWKRALDVGGAAICIVALSPILALIAIAVRLDSDGPAIFKQRRVGLRGRAIEMYKFRTMLTGCDAEAHRRYVSRMIRQDPSLERNGDGAFKLEHDARVTRVGALLRKASLDELPQLLNVLKGEMSLVGPRPPLDYEVELYTARELRRLEAVPGMTGLWQVRGRNATTFDQMIDLDLAYIEQRSPLLDLRILFETVGVVLAGRGS